MCVISWPWQNELSWNGGDECLSGDVLRGSEWRKTPKSRDSEHISHVAIGLMGTNEHGYQQGMCTDCVHFKLSCTDTIWTVQYFLE